MSTRPRVYKTEGIVLRRRNVGEADSIFTVYSDRDGKFEGVARGVRKARSHMRGHLEPLTRSRMMLARGRSLDVFTQAETVSPYRIIRDDLDLTAAALYCAELVDRFVVEHAVQEGLWDLLIDVLDAFEAHADLRVVRFFEVQILALTGYELQLDGCAVCRAALPPVDTMLSPAAGGFVCATCRPSAGAGRIVGVPAMKVLRYARTCSMAGFAALRLSPGLERELEYALAGFIRYTLDREPFTPRYQEEVARLPPTVVRAASGDVQLGTLP